MSETVNDKHEQWHAPVPVALRNPWLAALIAWLWPGAGHLYQRRYAKGILFMVCVLSTYFFGFALGQGRVVYASFEKPNFTYSYLCQVGVGLPALPALLQKRRLEADPQTFLPNSLEGAMDMEMMMPPGPVYEQSEDVLARWHKELRGFFELATLYTMVAGLLNMLVIYDAFAGPVFPQPEESQRKAKRPPPAKKEAGANQESKPSQEATG